MRARATTLVACAASCVLNLVFYWLLGLYAPRFTIAVLPPILVAVAVVGAGVLETETASTRRIVTAVLASSIALALAWVTFKPGPWC
jgi:hypothetical protein